MSDDASAKREFINRLTYGQKHKPFTLQDQIDAAQKRIREQPWLYGYKLVRGKLVKQ